jgi:hypothetical protein
MLEIKKSIIKNKENRNGNDSPQEERKILMELF